MTIRFEYRSGILEGANPDTGIEYCWFRGDRHITVSRDGQGTGEISVPHGATVTEVKRLIRQLEKP